MYKVLIADDEKKICKLIKCLVDWEEKGMEVISVVHSGLEALEIVKAKRPDIVITDIRMPELDGLDLIRELKEAHPDISFVIIRGYGAQPHGNIHGELFRPAHIFDIRNNMAHFMAQDGFLLWAEVQKQIEQFFAYPMITQQILHIT